MIIFYLKLICISTIISIANCADSPFTKCEMCLDFKSEQRGELSYLINTVKVQVTDLMRILEKNKVSLI